MLLRFILTMNNNSSSDNLLKVINIDVLTVRPDVFSSEEEKHSSPVAEIPVLNFELENGENFLMANIPLHIAIEIARRINGIESADSRLTLATLIPELCIIERVIIDSIVPYSTAYQATIDVRLEGFKEVQHFQMIPSHATLLALVSNAPIYVSKSLLEPSRGISHS